MQQQVVIFCGIDLPNDLLITILCKLPTKSLIRFRCVSKVWLSLIKSREFVNLYTAIHSNMLGDACDYLLASTYEPSLHILQFHFLSYGSLQLEADPFAIPISECKLSPSSPSPSMRRGRKCYETDSIHCSIILGPCNGIFCLRIYNRDHRVSPILLWNPSIRETRALSGVQTDLWNFGFGYDPKTDDYKVFYTHDHRHGNNNAHLVEVYSLHSDSWTTIDASYFFDGSKVWGNGYVHTSSKGSMFSWIGYHDPYFETPYLFTFDVSNEVFMETRLPIALGDSGVQGYRLIRQPVKRSQACICCWQNSGPGQCLLEFWGLLSECDSTSSWTKLRSVILKNSIGGCFLGLWKDKEILFVKDGNLASYDPTSQLITYTRGTHSYVPLCIGYTESMVSVKRGQHELGTKEFPMDQIHHHDRQDIFPWSKQMGQRQLQLYSN